MFRLKAYPSQVFEINKFLAIFLFVLKIKSQNTEKMIDMSVVKRFQVGTCFCSCSQREGDKSLGMSASCVN